MGMTHELCSKVLRNCLYDSHALIVTEMGRVGEAPCR